MTPGSLSEGGREGESVTPGSSSECVKEGEGV